MPHVAPQSRADLPEAAPMTSMATGCRHFRGHMSGSTIAAVRDCEISPPFVALSGCLGRRSATMAMTMGRMPSNVSAKAIPACDTGKPHFPPEHN